MTMFYTVMMQTQSSDHGAWEIAYTDDTSWENLDDLLEAIRDNGRVTLYELGIDALPDGMEDIRDGFSAAMRIWGYVSGPGAMPEYFGIIEHNEESEDQKTTLTFPLLSDARDAVLKSGIIDWDWGTADDQDILDSELPEFLYEHSGEFATLDDALRSFISTHLGQEAAAYGL
jgi:hypothetical protein